MHQGKVIEFGKQVQPILDINHGDIFAVFSNTIYLRSFENICCLGASELVSGPINIRTDLQQIEGLAVGDSWRYANNTLTLGNCYQLDTYSFTIRKQYQQSSMKNSYGAGLDNLEFCITTIEQALAHHLTTIETNQSGDVTSTLVQQHLLKYSLILLQHLQDSISSSTTIELPEQLKGMIGCGDGLTPAGDDILVGVLATLHHFNLNKTNLQLQSWVLENAQLRTNHISLAHLKAACSGQAVDHVHSVLEAIEVLNTSTNMVVNRKDLLLQASSKLAGYGHSSGHYALTGVLIVLKSIRQAHAS